MVCSMSHKKVTVLFYLLGVERGVLRSFLDLSSLTRNWIWAMKMPRVLTNHWTTREFPQIWLLCSQILLSLLLWLLVFGAIVKKTLTSPNYKEIISFFSFNIFLVSVYYIFITIGIQPCIGCEKWMQFFFFWSLPTTPIPFINRIVRLQPFFFFF